MRFEIPKKLARIEFGLFSPDEIRQMAVIRVDKPELYDNEGRGFPGGPLDPRLGAPDNREKCRTCGMRKRERDTGCMGHFGYIELARPIYHPGYIKLIEKILNAVCENCGRLTLPKNVRDEFWSKMKKFIDRYGFPNSKLARIVLNEAAKVKVCPYCSTPKRGKFLFIKKEYAFVLRSPVTPEEAEKIVEEESKKKLEEPEPIAGKKPIIVKGKKNKYFIIRYLGPSTIRSILSQIYDDLASDEEKEERRKDLLLMGFNPKLARPEWAVLTVLPVPPINVRPPVITADGKRSEDHLTITLRDIIRINEQLKNKMRGGPSPVIDMLWQKLQKLVEALYGLHKVGEIKIDNLTVKGIIHRLSGKEGRFRHNLSGKRVDYSGRAVISPDPYLSIDEIGIPEKMARVLTVPEVVNEHNIEEIKMYVRRGSDEYPGAVLIKKKAGPDQYRPILLEIFKSKQDRETQANSLRPGDIVERHVIDGDVIVFNRQPTLHRISMMAHYARVLPYNTLRLHVMTCPPYNADFDGDEMNIHLPRSQETRVETALIMGVKRHIISPRYGGPIIGPKQDYITGAYLLTRDDTYLSKDEAMRVLLYAGKEDLPPPDKEVNGEKYWSGKKIFSSLIPKSIFYEREIKSRLCGKKGKKCKLKIWDGEILEGIVDKNTIGAEKPKNLVQKIIESWGYDAGKKFLNAMSSAIIRYLTDRGFSLTLWDIRISEDVRKKIDKIIEDYLVKAMELVKQYKEGKLEPIAGKTVEETFEDKIVSILDEARNKAGDALLEYMNPESQFLAMTLTGARGDETNIQQVIAAIGQPVVRGKRLKRGYDRRVLPHFKVGDMGPLAGGFVRNSFSSGMSPIEYFFHNTGGRDSLVDTAVRTADSGYFYRRLVNALQDSRIEYDGTARMMNGYIVQFKYGGDGVHPGKSFHGKVGDYETYFYEIISRRPNKSKDQKKWPKYYDKGIKLLEDMASYAIAMDVKDLLKEMMKKGYVLTEDEMTEFLKKILDKYLRAQTDPGEAVGTVAAQSISEPATQLTLRTFHWAGVAAFSITTGLPRIKEIFDAVEKPSTPLITVYLTDDCKFDLKKAREIYEKIKAITIFDIIKKDAGITFQPQYGRLKIVLDRNRLGARKVSPEDVLSELEKLSKARLEREGKLTIYVYPTDEAVTLADLYKKIKEKVFKGIRGYEHTQIRKSELGEYYIVISSPEIYPLLFIDGVDISRLETNNIHAFAKIFGIEAARRLIVKEAKDVLDQYGLDVDMRHMLYVADVMTLRGVIDSIGRYGISGRKTSLLARAAFEETGKHLFVAAAAGMIDPLGGATENVIVGGIPPIGTGAVKLGFISKTKGLKNSEENP